MPDEPATHRRIEIVHESLLSAWPRLVRWRTQDVEGAQLRDQLHQAARLWEERGRPDDLLWTGTSFKEYELWRERYEGGLTELESNFAAAMTRNATRQRRRRRIALALFVASLLAILGIVTASRRHALEAASRAQAAQLLSRAELEMEGFPTAALAYATKSIEISDSDAARTLAMRALAQGPPVTLLDLGSAEEVTGRAHDVVFSPDGRWAALRGYDDLQIVGRDGQTRLHLEPFGTGRGGLQAVFDSAGNYLYGAKNERLRIWSMPDFELLKDVSLPGTCAQLTATESGVLALMDLGQGLEVESVSPTGSRTLARMESIAHPARAASLDPTGHWLAFGAGGEVRLRSLDSEGPTVQTIGQHTADIWRIRFDPSGERLAVADDSAVTRLWSASNAIGDPLRVFPTEGMNRIAFDPAGRWLAFAEGPPANRIDLWDLDAVQQARPTFLRTEAAFLNGIAIEPGGRWLASAHVDTVGFWPVQPVAPRVVAADLSTVSDIAFLPDGEHVVSATVDGTIAVWPLGNRGAPRILARLSPRQHRLAVERGGSYVAATDAEGVVILPLDGTPRRELVGFEPDTLLMAIAIDPAGHRIAAAGTRGGADTRSIRLWNLETGETDLLGGDLPDVDGMDRGFTHLEFLPDGGLLTGGSNGVVRVSIETGDQDVLAKTVVRHALGLSADRRYVLSTTDHGGLRASDLLTATTWPIESHGAVFPIAIHAGAEAVVTGGYDGVVRVGAISGEEPHLLIGHESAVMAVAVSPDGRWIVSGSTDGTIRLWPMPDLHSPPLHTLPRDDLLRKLTSLTNLRVVADPETPGRWTTALDRFPGWEEVPAW